MKNTSTARPRTLALLLAATVLPATPLFAQETVAPPPVTATTPQPVAEAPAATPPAAAQAPVFAPPSEVVQPVPVRAAPPEAVAEPAPRAAATATRSARPLTRTRAVAAPVAVTPAAAPAVVDPATVAAAPVPAPEPVATAVPETATSPVVDETTTSTTVTDQTPWMWIVGGLIALGAIVALLFSRRRRPVEEAVYEEPVYVAPVVAADPVIAPVAVAPVYTPPVAPKSATLVADDERPWIGLSLQATGSNERGEEDLVEYNLIVENAGEVMATDVRVSTFLIDGRTKSSGSETALIDAVGETQSRFIDLAPGSSVPIASTLSVPHGVDPCIIAEAHYPLPGGGEGHIAARFVIEATGGDTMEARLDDVLERV